MPPRSLTLFACLGLIGSLVHCVGDESGSNSGGSDASTPGSDASSNDATTNGDSSNPGDANTGNDGGPTDGAVEAGPACDLAKPFGMVQPIPGSVNSTDGEEYARESPDGLELYLTKYTPPYTNLKINRAVRSKVGDPWGVPSPVDAINRGPDGGATSVTAFTLAGNGLTAFMQLYDDNSGFAKAYTSTRSGALAISWSLPTLVATGGAGAHDGEWINTAGNRLYFFTGTPYRIAYSEKTGNTFSGSTVLAAIQAGEDRNPVLSPDELTLYFASYGPPPDGGASKRLTYVSKRTSTSSQFTSPGTFVPELNVPGYDTVPSWISPDGCTIYVYSNRVGTVGDFDIFYAKKPL